MDRLVVLRDADGHACLARENAIEVTPVVRTSVLHHHDGAGNPKADARGSFQCPMPPADAAVTINQLAEWEISDADADSTDGFMHEYQAS